jgi:hypothetical protein
MIRLAHPSFKQDCVICAGAQGSRIRGSIRWTSFPITEVPGHALARMLQRRPNIDLTAALYEAATAFLRADRSALRLDGETTLHLPCGPGLALTLPLFLLDLDQKKRLLARTCTWIAAEMAAPDQRPVAAAADRARSVLAAAVSGR